MACTASSTNDSEQSVISFVRWDRARLRPVVALCNFTPVPRHGYRIGLPGPGPYREVLNTDAAIYGGSNLGNGAGLVVEPVPAHGHPRSAQLVLPPLAALVLAPDRSGGSRP